MLLKQNNTIKANLSINVKTSQSLKLLEYSQLELDEYITDMAQKNIFLNSDEEQDKYDTYLSNSKNYSYTQSNIKQEYDNNIIYNVADKPTLKQHIIEQLNSIFKDEAEKNIATYLVDFITPEGYFNQDIDTINLPYKVSKNKISKIIDQLRQLEPSGIFASNLQECLQIQLIDKQIYDKNIKIILDNLYLLAGKKYSQLAKLCNKDENYVKTIHNIIKSLNPKPGLKYEYDKEVTNNSNITPDIYIYSINNQLQIEICDNFDNLKANQYYYNKLKSYKCDKSEKTMLSHQWQEAKWLINSIQRRKKTLFDITKTICDFQKNFFYYGINHLKPMTLSDVAICVNMHESTVSRAINNKWFVCNHGHYSMKSLFSSSVQNTQGDNNIASTSVKKIIQTIIKNSETPVSDSMICNQLRECNIHISRRTVNKYRKQMGISSSREFKKCKVISHQL